MITHIFKTEIIYEESYLSLTEMLIINDLSFINLMMQK